MAFLASLDLLDMAGNLSLLRSVLEVGEQDY